MWVQLNDEMVREEEARVSVFDRGFTYGDGIFETFRAYRGTPFRLDAHLNRMAVAADALRFDLPRSAAQIRSDIGLVLERNRLTDAVVRINVSRGRGGRGPGIEGVYDPTYVVSAWPIPGDLDDRRARGASLCTVSTRRPDPRALPAVAKLANYLNSVLVVAEAADRGCDDGLMLTTDGALAECGVANVFLVRSGVLATPALRLGVIPGITRGLVLELAENLGIGPEQSVYGPQALGEAGEVFVTNSIVGILPVRSADRCRYPVPGAITTQLMASYRERVLAETGGSH
jgi:branched-chain amino acid aminotransferase